MAGSTPLFLPERYNIKQRIIEEQRMHWVIKRLPLPPTIVAQRRKGIGQA